MDRDLVLAAIVASVVVAMIVASASCAWFCWKRRVADPKFNRKSGSSKIEFSSPKALADGKGLVPVFEYASLESATDDFDKRNILGEGGFRRVYRARLDDGVLVAVKRVEIGGRKA